MVSAAAGGAAQRQLHQRRVTVTGGYQRGEIEINHPIASAADRGDAVYAGIVPGRRLAGVVRHGLRR
jgi:hypothetical protein